MKFSSGKEKYFNGLLLCIANYINTTDGWCVIWYREVHEINNSFRCNQTIRWLRSVCPQWSRPQQRLSRWRGSDGTWWSLPTPAFGHSFLSLLSLLGLWHRLWWSCWGWCVWTPWWRTRSRCDRRGCRRCRKDRRASRGRAGWSGQTLAGSSSAGSWWSSAPGSRWCSPQMPPEQNLKVCNKFIPQSVPCCSSWYRKQWLKWSTLAKRCWWK